ncbi:probable calcium-binding protein CML48 isoform X2 [Punica granatum]|uniref:Probable calcium-binding protein CML48 isoform X2 n=1 Tax=Punica granatum TaxID=22663 RepID=A0A6P8CSS2_PUNGR|nr:probable calcium-binding protein CML48 isoform X2 [Punica granatum]
MASFGRWNSLSYAPPASPSAPSLPGRSQNSGPHESSPYPEQLHSSYSRVFPAARPDYYYIQPSFPPGTDLDVIRAFHMVDRDRSGFIDENELRQALCTGYQRFNPRTIRLLMFLFRNPSDPLRVGPKEFAALWSCLKQWRGIFERFDRDRSGKIDLGELRDALYSLGYAVPPSVLQVLISRYDDGSCQRVELNFDSFIECGMILKGLTEKFKEKDKDYTGSATVSYDVFLSMTIPFLVSYN